MLYPRSLIAELSENLFVDIRESGIVLCNSERES
jgi:hypothetical protein